MHLILKNTNILSFTLSYAFSSMGYELVIFIMTVHVFGLTGSIASMGIFIAISFAPRILLAPLMGLLIDYFNRKKTLLFTYALHAGLMLVFSLTSNIAVIFCCWFLYSLILTMSIPVSTVVMVNMTNKKDLLAMNSLVFIVRNMIRIVVPSIAGIAVFKYGIQSALVVASFVFIFSLVSILPLSLDSQPFTFRHKNIRGEILSDMIEGIINIFKTPELRYLAWIGMTWRLFLALQIPLFIVYVQESLLSGVKEYGYFMTSVGIGSVLGSFAGSQITKVFASRLIIYVGLSASYLTFSSLFFIHVIQTAICAIGLSFFFFMIGVVNVHYQRDLNTLEKYRGRVYASTTAIFSIPAVVSLLIAPYATTLLGVNVVFLIAGIGAFVSLSFIHFLLAPKVFGT